MLHSFHSQNALFLENAFSASNDLIPSKASPRIEFNREYSVLTHHGKVRAWVGASNGYCDSWSFCPPTLPLNPRPGYRDFALLACSVTSSRAFRRGAATGKPPGAEVKNFLKHPLPIVY